MMLSQQSAKRFVSIHCLFGFSFAFAVVFFIANSELVAVQDNAVVEQEDVDVKQKAEEVESVSLGVKELPLVFSENFEDGHDRWEMTDDEAWTRRNDSHDDNPSFVFGLNRRKSDYKPKFRSPHNIALIKDLQLSDFVITFDVRSTKDTGNHRDCCVFFAHQNESQFYYCHLGAKPDPASGQIMIVNEAARAPMTENEKPVGWSDDWHQVKVTRDAESGQIDVYFDDMEKPQMSAVDKTFALGRIGIGSFDDMNDFDNLKVYGSQEEADADKDAANK